MSSANQPAVPPHIFAIIAAALHVAYAGRLRVVAVAPTSVDIDWAREGRRDIFFSHRVR